MRPREAPLRTALLLGGALFLVFLFALLPHADLRRPDTTSAPAVVAGAFGFVHGETRGNVHAVHWDEVVHLDHAADIRDGASVTLGEGLRSAVHERGFQVLLAEFDLLLGADPRTTVMWLPAIWSVFTAFALFALLRPHPAAPYAAAAFALVPTTARFLGPAFLVPIGFVLPWIVAAALLEREARKGPVQAALLLVVLVWAFFVHLIGGFAALAVVLLALVRRVSRREAGAARALGVVLAVLLLGVLVAWDSVVAEFSARVPRVDYLEIDTRVFGLFGPLALGAWAAGAAWLLVRARPADDAAWPFAAASVLFVGSIAWTVVFDPTRYATYDRWHVPFLFVACVGAGYAAWGLGEVAGWIVARSRVPRAAAAAGAVAVSVLFVAASIGSTAVARAENRYLYPVSDADAVAVETLIGLDPAYDRFAAQRHFGVYASAISGREWVTSRITDLDELLAKEVTVVLDNDHPPEFRKIGPNIAVLPPAERDALKAARATNASG